MATYIVTLDGTYNNEAAANVLENLGIKILKDYNIQRAFLVETTQEEIDKIPGLEKCVDYAKNVNVTLEVINTDHLNYTVDITGKKKYNPEYRGTGRSAYVVDTGINKNHVEFVDTEIVDLFTTDDNFDDYNGHGTAMASLMVGKNIGASPNAKLYNVKMFNSGAGGITVGEIIEAFEAIIENHLNTSSGMIEVVSMSWIADQDDLIDFYVQEMDEIGLMVVCAAGNNGIDVNTLSPAGVERVLTVGAFNRDLEVTSFTNAPFSGGRDGFVNYGAQLDIFALGVDVTMADHTDNAAYSIGSGTSISTAIAAGIAIHYCERYNDKNVNEIKDIFISEGKVWGVENLVFDNAVANIDYSTVNKSVVTTEQAEFKTLALSPSGKIVDVKLGVNTTFDIGLNTNAENVEILSFAPTPPWIVFDIATGIVQINSAGIDPDLAPGVYLFAIKGTVDGEVLVEEFSVGLYNDTADELDSVSGFYFDDESNSYDEVVNYQVAPSVKF